MVEALEFAELYHQRNDKRLARNRGKKRTYTISSLWQRHHEIINRAFLGESTRDIAKAMGVTPATVQNCLQSEVGMKKLEALRMERDVQIIDVRKEIDALLPEAVKVYRDILASQDAGLKLKKETADTLLMEIGGYAAPKKVQAAVAHLDLSDIEAMKERGRREMERLASINLGEEHKDIEG